MEFYLYNIHLLQYYSSNYTDDDDDDDDAKLALPAPCSGVSNQSGRLMVTFHNSLSAAIACRCSRSFLQFNLWPRSFASCISTDIKLVPCVPHLGFNDLTLSPKAKSI